MSLQPSSVFSSSHAAIAVVKNGSVTSPKGFRAAGIAAGIKKSRGKDMALVASDVPAEVAAVFTTNQIKAAPVKVSMQHARSGKVRAVIANSGGANACTGIAGLRDAKEMTEVAAKALGCKGKEVLVCSTGRIGVLLPMPTVRRGIRSAVEKLDADGGAKAAEAIMTTDTFAKSCAVKFEIDGRPVVIGGIAKGAGMIHPDMATMLCFVTTDALVDRAVLRRAVEECVGKSFNSISVDGDTSTNDTVVVLANGQAGNPRLGAGHLQLPVFQQALCQVMRHLSRLIVEDGEGITKVVEIVVKGAATRRDAKLAALAVGNSTLVKCSWCGNDPNWGRIMDALGYSQAKVREELVEIFYNGVQVTVNGLRSGVSEARIRKVVAKSRFVITLHLHLGQGEYTFLTTDLSEEYVTLNKGE